METQEMSSVTGGFGVIMPSVQDPNPFPFPGPNPFPFPRPRPPIFGPIIIH